MSSFARGCLWLFGVLLVVQLVLGGWSRMRAWLSVKFIGVDPKTAAVAHG